MNYVTLLLILGILTIVAGCWCMIRTYHMLKITIGIEIAMKAITLFIILAGEVNGNIALAQSYIITVIVIEVVIAVVGIGTAVGLFRKYGSMDIRNLTRLKG
ncbi:MAG TPA: NADH-quinone oxidoreductase subunit K [Clostridia bacterium]|nr:NADH-quinone oxidoreductase subunit K [Clostridia bacterium]